MVGSIQNAGKLVRLTRKQRTVSELIRWVYMFMNMACLNAGIRYLYDAQRVVNRRAERTLAVVGARRRGALPRRVVEEGAAAFAVVTGSAVPTVAHQAAVFSNTARCVAVALAPGACSPRGHEHTLHGNCGPGRERLPPQPLPILHTNFCSSRIVRAAAST